MAQIGVPPYLDVLEPTREQLSPILAVSSEFVGPTGKESLTQTAQRVVGQARAALVGSQRGGARVDALLHYGAVDIDPRHLVVWILLSGKSDDQLAEWMSLEPGLVNRSEPGQIDYRWLSELRAETVRRFGEANWPMPDGLAVYADSSHRVDTHEGSLYFKNG